MIHARRLFPRDETKYGVIYQWWDDCPGQPLLKKTQLPVLFSIATVRYHNPHIPIFIIDYSDTSTLWEDFPKRLGFEIVRIKPALEMYSPHKRLKHVNEIGGDSPMFIRMSSRSLDVWEFTQQSDLRYFIYTDSDTFWRTSIIPPENKDPNYFHCRWNNCGVFVFDKQAEKVQKLFQLWMSHVLLATRSKSYRRKQLSKRMYRVVQDESTYIQLQFDYSDLMSSLTRELDRIDNFIDFYKFFIEDLTACRCMHAVAHIFTRPRAWIPWLLKDFSFMLKEVFSEDELKIACEEVFEYEGRFSLNILKEGILESSEEAVKEMKLFLKVIGKEKAK